MNGFSFRWGTRTETPFFSMREEKPDVLVCIFLEITDGIFKNLFFTQREKPLFFKKSFFHAENVPVGCPVRGVITGDAMPLAVGLHKEQDTKGKN